MLRAYFNRWRRVFVAKHHVLLLLFLCCVAQVGYGQTRTYLTGQKTGRTRATLLVSTASISSPLLAPTVLTPFYYAGNGELVETTTRPATIRIGSLLNLAGLIEANAYIQFRNTNNAQIEGGKTTYITLNEAPNFNGLLSVPLSQQEFLIGEAYTNAGNYTLGEVLGPVANERAGNKVSNTTSELLIDHQERWYIGITPLTSYNSVRLRVETGNALLSVADAISTNIYNAFYENSGGACSIYGRFTTPGEVTGISVNLLNLNKAIADPHYVLNSNPDQYAAYSSGVASIGVATSISQTIVYDHKASATDGINVKLGLANNLIGLDVLSTDAIYMYAYDGPSSSAVWEGSLADVAQLLDLDLLDLINLGGSHSTLEFTVTPGVQFDRIRIQFNPGLIDVGVIGDALRVYHIKLAPAVPSIIAQPIDQQICEGDNVTFEVSATSSGGPLSYQWQYYNGSSWVNAPGDNGSATYTILNAPLSLDKRLFRVAITGGYSGCEQTVFSGSSELHVLPLPGKPHLTISDVIN